ncbi:matrixin family metalloprotease [Flavobacterium sp.]|uniref:matrixin family metalloprotease n=1 Tax=Flavobacterium sp. TaxID=239 RepID=UPI002FDA0C05
MKLISLVLVVAFFWSCSPKTSSETKVGILPYVDFPKAKTDTIAKIVHEFYGVKTIILPNKMHDVSTFINVKSPRYRADKIIKLQKEELPDSLDYIIGLTEKDISTSKKENGKIKEPTYKYEDWGIMGLAYCPGKSCVVSTFRIQHKNKAVHFMRLKKVTVHEFGHNFGLPHCPDKKCVMTDAVESVATIDNAQLSLCQSCQNKLK